MKFRPCIDLHQGKVKQIVGSSLRDADAKTLRTNFESDHPPSYYAAKYRRDSLFGGHVVMLGPGNEKAALEALAAFPGGLHAGGGISPSNAKTFLDNGASHVIISSYIFTGGVLDLEHLQECAKTIGKERLVLDLSCKKQDGHYRIMIDRWQTMTDLTLSKETFSQLAPFCDEFLIHATEIEGQQAGIDQELVEILGKNCKIPITYAGGIRSLADLELVKKLGQERVDATVGSALDIFGGPLSYSSVVQWQRHQDKP
jgi:phosphoribosylformimino-5-aminoimidazole carboxamide ribotide isomerase